MVLAIILVGCVGWMATGSCASQPPYFIHRVEGGGGYLGQSGAVNQPIALRAGVLNRNTIRPTKLGARVPAVVPSNVRLVLTDPVDKKNDEDKQQPPSAQQLFVLILELINQLIQPIINAQGNGNPDQKFWLVGPMDVESLSKLQLLLTGKLQESKQPVDQYEPTLVSPNYPLEDTQDPEAQLANSGIVHSAAEEPVANEVVPVGDSELEAVAATGTKGLKKFQYRRRPGVVYLIPKVRVSKGIEENSSDSSAPDTTTTTSEPTAQSAETR